MNFVAIKMLIGDRAKYIGILIGITFASLLITQQSAIFVGVMCRTFGTIVDIGLPDIWVMDPKVQFIEDIKPLQDTELYRVRGVEGVEWAVPLYKGLLKARLSNGSFQTCNVIGLDDATLIGGPPVMVEGRLADLRLSESVIVDIVGATTKLAKPGPTPDAPKTPIKVGDTLELNDHRAIVVGLCKVTRTFQSQPVIYTTYTRATTFAPREPQIALLRAGEGQARSGPTGCVRENPAGHRPDGLHSRGVHRPDTQVFPQEHGHPDQFRDRRRTRASSSAPVIAGQTFYNFTLDNLRYFGTLKAMGTTNFRLLRMILLQAVMVGVLGYGLGVGSASGLGWLLRNTELAFRMPWQLLVVSAVVVMVICAISAVISIYKVMRLEPAIVFKS